MVRFQLSFLEFFNRSLFTSFFLSVCMFVLFYLVFHTNWCRIQQRDKYFCFQNNLDFLKKRHSSICMDWCVRQVSLNCIQQFMRNCAGEVAVRYSTANLNMAEFVHVSRRPVHPCII